MKLRELFTADVVNLEIQAESKDDILRELVGQLSMDEKSAGILYKTLRSRESLGSTGIGKGIAIPHCRISSSNKIIGTLVKLDEAINFDAIDGQPVDLLFVLLVPEEAHDEGRFRLRALSTR